MFSFDIMLIIYNFIKHGVDLIIL